MHTNKLINLFDYLPQSLRSVDTEKELQHVTVAIDHMISEIAQEILKTSWDIENSSRTDLDYMAESLGLFPKKYFSDEIMRRYIRSAGHIRELKGTDELIKYLIDNLTHFRVYEIYQNEALPNTLAVRVLRKPDSNFDIEEKALDHLITTYKKLTLNYAITYIMLSKVVLTIPDTSMFTHTIISSTRETVNLNHNGLANYIPEDTPTMFYTNRGVSTLKSTITVEFSGTLVDKSLVKQNEVLYRDLVIGLDVQHKQYLKSPTETVNLTSTVSPIPFVLEVLQASNIPDLLDVEIQTKP